MTVPGEPASGKVQRPGHHDGGPDSPPAPDPTATARAAGHHEDSAAGPGGAVPTTPDVGGGPDGVEAGSASQVGEPASAAAGPAGGPASSEGGADEAETTGPEAVGVDEEPAEPVAVSAAELGELKRERDDYLDALRRLQADFENYRKRVQRQQDEAVARAAEQLVGALLPALDAFELAAEHLVGDEEVSPGGLLQAAALLRDILAKEGVERLGEVGDRFDPTAHEAVEHVTDDAPGEGPVVEAVLRAGYRYRGRTIRPAMVKVRG